MKFIKANVLAILPVSAYGWKPFTDSIPAQAITNGVGESAADINSSQLLLLDLRKPAVYTDAMLALKRLEEKPICHRIAAQLLMKNCQGLEDINVDKYQVTSSKMQRHHVECFAAGLAMCDMERADFEIPEDCAPFRSSSLNEAMEGTGSINVSSENVSACLQGLGRDPAQWSTWLSYRDTALLICRGARVEVEKSDQIELHKELTRIMEEFTTGLHDDLEDMRGRMKSQAEELESHFVIAKSNLVNLRLHFEENFGILLTDVKNFRPKLNSVNSAIDDARRMMHNIVNTMLQSNAEIAASQEGALTVVAKNYERHIEVFNDLVGGVEVTLLATQQKMEGLLSVQVAGMKDRMDAIEVSSQKATSATMIANELLELHTEALYKASASASRITETLEEAAGGILGRMPWSSWVDLFIHGAASIITLYGGNYGTTPSTKKNLILLASGYIASQGLTFIWHPNIFTNWLCDFQALSSSGKPSSFSQLVAQWRNNSMARNEQTGEQSTRGQEGISAIKIIPKLLNTFFPSS